jgi:CubicO group peptidase (beta-lactamase class C family)
MNDMRKLFFTGLLNGCVFILSIAQSPTIDPEKIRRLDSLFKVFFPANEPGAVVLLASHGSPVFKKAYGMANTELNVPMNTDHKLGIGSISKQFAAVSILLLQQEGKLNIKDDIHKYLPAYNTHGRVITIENLLTHTSGIPSYTELYGFDSLVDKKVSVHKLVKFFEVAPLLFEPGNNWSYSNSGYLLAAEIVKKLSGVPFNDFLQQRIFKPLLMTETTIGTSDYTIANKTGEYASNNKGRVKMETQYDWYWAYGAGQIVSTADDMLKWDQGLYNAAFLSPAVLAMAHKTFLLSSGQPANYGLGWAVGAFKNRTMIQHGGAIGGYRALGMRIPDDHLYLITLSNSGSSNTALISNKALSIIYDMAALKENKEPGMVTKDIAGVYEAPGSGLRLQSNFGNIPTYYTVRVDSNNKVTARRTGGTLTVLSPVERDVFYDKNAPFTKWQIERNDKGEVVGIRFKFHFPGVGPERLNKKISNAVPADKKELKGDSLALVKFGGLYEHEFGDQLKISVDKNNLLIEELATGLRFKPIWLGENRFYLKDVDWEIVFDTNKKGLITGLHYFNGAQNRQFRKIEELY